ncbi:MAG: TolC family protein, partial [Parabacteroides sp.]
MKKVLCFLLFFSIGMQAQTLSLQQAIDQALKKNFNILVSRSNANIDKLNNTRGNAGMLPTVTLNGSGEVSYNNIHQKLSSG